MISIRPARTEDAPILSAILTASIAQLCAPDHGNDADALAAWTANKTPEGIRRMLANPDLTMLIAERAGDPAAVGAITAGGDVALNYVAPAHRFAGVSRALLAAMEDTLRQRGVREARLVSTRTAHRFYLDAGWLDVASADGELAMCKRL